MEREDKGGGDAYYAYYVLYVLYVLRALLLSLQRGDALQEECLVLCDGLLSVANRRGHGWPYSLTFEEVISSASICETNCSCETTLTT